MKVRQSFIVSIIFISTYLFSADLLPIPKQVQINKAKMLLGKKLFLDPILSKNKKLSCYSCHNLKYNGADTVQYTPGIDEKMGYFNVPTVYNAVYNFRQFWDGRAKNLKEQAMDPIANPIEMGNTISNALKDLKNSKIYNELFSKIYTDGITKANLADALVEFEKVLITPNSPFDQYLKGNKKALNNSAIEGYRLFKEKGCISCHNGINAGGNLYNKFGIYEDAKSKEYGRYNTTHKEYDKYVFKVPSLRNIALTSPYMHDGRAKTLDEAVDIMSLYQLGRPMNKENLRNIVDFLKSLTGELPEIVKDIND